jgi:protein phosphatase
MGGHAAGEVASAIVLEKIPECVRRGQNLPQALRETHRAIQRAAEEGHGAPGMGSTVVVLRMKGADYEIAWVGDSRAYLWDGKVLRQLSRDHSFVEKLIAAQAITAEEAERHPDRNVITQALGMAEYDQLRPDTMTGRLYRGEQILLCSDGLSSEVGDDEIARVLASHRDSESRARALVEKARRAGGADNITVLLVRAPEDAPRRLTTTAPFDSMQLTRALQARSRRRRWGVGLAMALSVMCAALGWVLWVFLRANVSPVSVEGGATTEQAQRATPPVAPSPPVIPAPPVDAAPGVPSPNKTLKSDPEEQPLPGTQTTPKSPADVVIVDPLPVYGAARDAQRMATEAKAQRQDNARKRARERAQAKAKSEVARRKEAVVRDAQRMDAKAEAGARARDQAAAKLEAKREEAAPAVDGENDWSR